MRWPSIHKEIQRDFYVLVAADPTLERVRVTVAPGETEPIAITKYKLHYKKFFMNGGPGQAGTMMGGEMELITPEGKAIPFKTGFQLTDSGLKGVTAQIPEVNGAAIAMGSLDPATKQLTVGFELPEAPALWKIPVAVTNKPWINLVWVGIVVMGIGVLLAMIRRALEARKISDGPMSSAGTRSGWGPAEIIGEKCEEILGLKLVHQSLPYGHAHRAGKHSPA